MSSEEKTDTTLGIRISSKQKAAIDFVWKFGVFALLLLQLFLKTQYVSQVDYKQDRDDDAKGHAAMEQAIVEINTLLKVMEAKNELNSRQDLQLQDHEARLRSMENGKKR